MEFAMIETYYSSRFVPMNRDGSFHMHKSILNVCFSILTINFSFSGNTSVYPDDGPLETLIIRLFIPDGTEIPIVNNKSKVFPDIPEQAKPLLLLKANYLTVDLWHLEVKIYRFGSFCR